MIARDKSYDDSLTAALRDPIEAAAFLNAAFEMGGPSALLPALRQVADTQAFWGSNYQRLLSTKPRHDPQGLFFVRHGVGSELWSSDGFTRRR